MRLVIAFLLVGSQLFAQTIKRAEYYFDADPGKGNGTSISVTQGASINETHTISVASLGNGPHTFGMRVLDSDGKWSQSATRTFFIVTPVITTLASSIKKAEYFFDADPGVGSATPLAISSSSSENNSFVIGINSLSSGFHQLCIRYQDNLGRWSLFGQRTFYLVPVPNVVNSTTLKKAEYFFDSDPGRGNGISLPISSSATENNLFAININSLTPGFHQLAIRYQDDKGYWSLFAHRTFYIVPPVNLNSSTVITKAEYFFDNDPGIANGISVPISSSAAENYLFAINISSLTPGFHQLAIRYKDDKGHWSLFTNRTFYIVPPASVSASTALGKAEYFFDSDPGAGQGTTLSLTANGSQDNIFALDVSSLTKGFHQLMIRYQDNNGRWSTFGQRTFYILPGTILPTTLQKIEYFIDTDPGFDKGNALTIAGASVNQMFNIDLGTTPPGNHMLYVRVKDSKGYWSAPVVSSSFSIASCSVPTAPVGADGSRCDAGSVTLSASGAASNQQYRWYVDGTTNTIAFTGPSFSTPLLNGNQDYYASVFDPSTGCESSRTKVSAAVTIIPKPKLNPSGSLTLCEGNSLTIAGPVGYAGYSWSNAATTPSITTSTSASYTVTVSDGTCMSAPSDPLVLTVVPRPTKPIAQALTGTIVCGNGSVVLSAPNGASSYLWSDGRTSQQISATATASYSVQITDANNCQSVSSDPIAVQFLPAPTKPTILALGPTVLCKNASTILSAPVGFSKYLWNTGDTTAQIIVSSAGNFTVKAGNATCMSVFSDPASVTVAGTQPKPVIQVTSGSLTICGSGSVTLKAPLASSYLWSDGSTGQTISPNTAGKYSVIVTDVNNCPSDASDQMAVQVVSIPGIPTISAHGSTALCSGASVILAASPGYTKYLWSSGDTTAQILTSATQQYTVQVGNASNCFSTPSVAISVTQSNLPCSGTPDPKDVPPSIANATIAVPVGTAVSFGLRRLIKKSDYGAGVNFSTLRIAFPLTNGMNALITMSDSLWLDFKGSNYVGADSIGIQVCDSLGSCTERTLTINVVAQIEVFNAVSPYPDGLNDFLNLKYIDKIDDTKKNKVTIVDRWGNEVFSVSDYNNADRVFKGIDNGGKELPSGTYYYRIDFESGRQTLSGFLSLKR